MFANVFVSVFAATLGPDPVLIVGRPNRMAPWRAEHARLTARTRKALQAQLAAAQRWAGVRERARWRVCWHAGPDPVLIVGLANAWSGGVFVSVFACIPWPI